MLNYQRVQVLSLSKPPLISIDKGFSSQPCFMKPEGKKEVHGQANAGKPMPECHNDHLGMGSIRKKQLVFTVMTGGWWVDGMGFT